MAQNNAQQIETIEHVPASGQGREFPPFEKQTFPSQLFWLALTFILLYLLMSRVALPRISSILEVRRKSVEADLTEAQRLKDESDAAMLAHEKALADARARAQTLANETHEKSAAAAEARRKEVDAKLASRIAEAEKTIAATRSAAIANVHGVASEAAAAIVERLTGIAPAGEEVNEAVSNVLKR
jgi:F-type H+-transporting ATPase subunit b